MFAKLWKKLFSKPKYLVLDIGTTGIKAFAFDKNLNVLEKSYKTISKFRPKPGYVEQDPMEILNVSISLLRDVYNKTGCHNIRDLSLGITNQRETITAWDKSTGVPIYKSISWEDSRTEKDIHDLSLGYIEKIRDKTGLYPEAYFSATKMSWLMNNCEDYDRENILWGTLDTWILWNITKDKKYVTDFTNASRTLLFNIKNLSWDDELLSMFGVAKKTLADVVSSMSFFGFLDKDILGQEIPVNAVCADQQSSLFAAGIEVGTTKVTYGTGIFIMQIIGGFAGVPPFYTTLALGGNGEALFALEAKIGGSAEKIDKIFSNNGVGLREQLYEFAEEANRYLQKLPQKPSVICIDGGIIQNKDLVVAQSTISNVKIIRHKVYDGTGFGVAKILKRFDEKSNQG